MPSAVELALTSLLPTTNFLPQELIDLATAFVAQSQSRASTLKPEEEIARTYACCHVACQRMGKKLSLEIGEPRPPVKPSVYKKLHTYMNSVLRTPTTPRARRVEDRLGSGKAVESSAEGKDGGVRARSNGTTSTTPTTIVTPSTRRKRIVVTSQPSTKVDIPLVAAADGLEEISCDARVEPEDDEEEDIITPAERPAKTPLWRKEKHARSGSGEDEVPGPAGLLPGLGTMFQSSVDWLSDERRANYALWKQSIMREIGTLEARG